MLFLLSARPGEGSAPENSHLLGEGKAGRGELGEQSLPAAPGLAWGHRRAGATLGEPGPSRPGPAAARGAQLCSTTERQTPPAPRPLSRPPQGTEWLLEPPRFGQ